MAKAVYFMRLGGEEVLTTLDIQTAAPPDLATAQALQVFWTNGLAFLMSEELTLEQITIDGEPYGFNEPGGITRESVPSNVAVVFRKLTGTGVKGRFFMPGVTDANVDNAGRLDSAFLTAFNNQMPGALTQLQQAGVTPVVQSTTQGQFPITSIAAAPVVGTQRRRLAKR